MAMHTKSQRDPVGPAIGGGPDFRANALAKGSSPDMQTKAQNGPKLRTKKTGSIHKKNASRVRNDGKTAVPNDEECAQKNMQRARNAVTRVDSVGQIDDFFVAREAKQQQPGKKSR